jgi:hypothetical protein
MGILERRLLGASMSVALFVVEWRLRRRGVQAARDAMRDTHRGTP